MQAVQDILAAERDTDLIVLSGDMVSGFRNRYSRPGWFEEQCAPAKNRTAPAVELRTPLLRAELLSL